ncbi:CHAD domain-containing protein [Sphingomonas crusticola]|uniref:CYTH and CHAD domain-containing protein n=1 Tax=Sphingomonas crusticola TaxID=1697973 RepID=UPI000E274602|nr:CHAD domain-containing protein [Sphingomonas crusticola]
MTGELEIELKLEADPGGLDALAQAPILADAKLDAREQVSTYFDTPRRELRAAGVSLRIRRIDARYVQTVKAEGASAAGLFARPEWEGDVPDEAPVIDEAAGPLTTLLSEKVLGSIAPAFTVEVTRSTGRFHYEGGEIEVVLDRGRIFTGNRTVPVNEVELELKAGRSDALFALARAMNAVTPLRLGVLSKSERGYRLAGKANPKSLKAEPVVVGANMSVAEVFQAVAGACLRHFRLNEAILERTGGAEALHQARVALRRLRSALSLFKPLLADDRFEWMRTELRWLAATLGEARDIDVLLGRAEAGSVKLLRVARSRAYADVHAALSSQRARDLMIDLSEWIAIGRWRMEPADPGLRDRRADRFAAEMLQQLRRRLKRRGRELLQLSDEERHEVRILAKKLRYASEFFVGLFSGKKVERRSTRFLAALETLQQHLGDLNDLAHGPSVLARLGIDVGDEGVPAERREKLLGKAAEAHAELADTKPFWR